MSDNASGLKEDRKKVLRRAFSMATGTLTSRILGLFRDIALAALFDRMVTDAWTAAFRLPNLFRRILGEGSLSVSFIPVFVQTQSEDSTGVRARNLVNGLYTLFLFFFGALALLGIFNIEAMFHLLLSDGYAQDSEKWNLTLRMGQIMFGFVFFVCIYAYFMGILNALGSFGLPALGAALLNISMLIFTFLPPTWFPKMGDGLAWGVLVGGVLQAALLWWALRAKGYLPRFQFKFWGEDVQSVLKRMLPGLLGVGLSQFATLVNLYFASALPEGSISYIYWADRLLEFPLSLISVSLGAAILPTLSDFAARKDMSRLREAAQDGFLMNLFLALPAALGLYLLAGPIVDALFLRGQFSVQDAQATTAVLQIYAMGLLAMSLSRVLLSLYYSVQNVAYPAIAALISLSLHIYLAPILMAQSGLHGLILAGFWGAVVNALLLLLGLSYWGLSFEWSSLMKSVAKMSVSAVGVIAVVQIYMAYYNEMGRSLKTASLIAVIVIAAAIYMGVAGLLKTSEFIKIRQSFR